jgi:uncharacterized BrkB/YihY/UPF0761 family membrane protein
VLLAVVNGAGLRSGYVLLLSLVPLLLFVALAAVASACGKIGRDLRY